MRKFQHAISNLIVAIVLMGLAIQASVIVLNTIEGLCEVVQPPSNICSTRCLITLYTWSDDKYNYYLVMNICKEPLKIKYVVGYDGKFLEFKLLNPYKYPYRELHSSLIRPREIVVLSIKGNPMLLIKSNGCGEVLGYD